MPVTDAWFWLDAPTIGRAAEHAPRCITYGARGSQQCSGGGRALGTRLFGSVPPYVIVREPYNTLETRC